MDTYQADCDRLLDGQGRISEMLRSQVALFCTWAAIQGYDLATAAGKLDEHKEWLIGWGFPPRSADQHVLAIRRRLEAL